LDVEWLSLALASAVVGVVKLSAVTECFWSFMKMKAGAILPSNSKKNPRSYYAASQPRILPQIPN
jgi:hypothetical protein